MHAWIVSKIVCIITASSFPFSLWTPNTRIFPFWSADVIRWHKRFLLSNSKARNIRSCQNHSFFFFYIHIEPPKQYRSMKQFNERDFIVSFTIVAETLGVLFFFLNFLACLSSKFVFLLTMVKKNRSEETLQLKNIYKTYFWMIDRSEYWNGGILFRFNKNIWIFERMIRSYSRFFLNVEDENFFLVSSRKNVEWSNSFGKTKHVLLLSRVICRCIV